MISMIHQLTNPKRLGGTRTHLPRLRFGLVRFAATALFVALATGCAGGPWSSRAAPDVHPLKAKRAEEAGKLFGDGRDRSEFAAAQFAWRQNDVQGCRELLEKVLKRNPGHRDSGLLLAELLLVEQHPDEARRCLEQVLLHHPNDAEALDAMGLLLEAEDKPAEAHAYFVRASQAAPENAEYRLSCQAAAERSQPPSEAAAIVSDDKVSDREASNDHETVRLAASEAPTKSWLEETESALAADQLDAARGHVREAQRSSPHDETIAVSAAVLAIKHDELELAVEFAQAGAAAFPDAAGIYRALGTAQYRLGDLEPAKTSFERAISLDKSHPLSYFLLGSTMKRLGQTAAAEAHFRQAERLDPRYAARR